MNKHKHSVKLHKWINGILHHTEHHFDSFHSAREFAEQADGHHAKVMDQNGSVVHEAVNTNVPASGVYN